MSKVTVTIAEDGSATVDVDGVKGKGCEELTAQIEKALGTVSERKLKPEHRQQEERHGQRQNIGR